MAKRAFFLGIKGVGMTSLALSMQDAGWTVSGSDTPEIFITDEVLNRRGIPVSIFSSSIPQTDLLVYSAAYDPSPYLTSTSKALSLAEALAEFVKNRRVIAVAGVGGKTTTTSMLAALFYQQNRQVGYYVGTNSIAGMDAPGAVGTDPFFVIEADEYAISKKDPRPKFSLLNPEIVITTNILHDHPDIYPDETATLSAFASLILKLPSTGAWVYNDQDPLTKKLLLSLNPRCKLMPYSLALPPLQLSVFGEQNQLDAWAAVTAAQAAGLTQDDAQSAIIAYHGAGRRQESHGEHRGRLLFDDYGHHPAEILVTTESFKAHYPKNRLLLVFESHTYSRTESLFHEFCAALSHADLTFIMPIFESAREKGKPHTITTQSFAAQIHNAQALEWSTAAAKIWALSRPGDIILTMGAGFVYKLHKDFKQL